MRRIRFVRNVQINAVEGPVGYPDRLAFAAGEVVDINDASAERFVHVGEAVFVSDPAPVAPPRPEPDDDADLEPASVPETDGEADIAAPEAPVKRRPGRPRKEA